MIIEKTENQETIQSAQEQLYNELFKPIGLPKEMREHLTSAGKEHYFVCRSDNEVIGTMVLVIDGEKAELNFGAVSSTQRGKGIGKKLMAAVLEYAREQGVKTVELSSRDTAFPFWKSVGFVETPDDWFQLEEFKQANIRHKKMEIVLT